VPTENKLFRRNDMEPIAWFKCDRAWVGVRQRYKKIVEDVLVMMLPINDNFVGNESVSLWRVMRWLEKSDIPYTISTVEPCENPRKVLLPLSLLVEHGYDRCEESICALLKCDKTEIEIDAI
jgi:hypothetical protein